MTIRLFGSTREHQFERLRSVLLEAGYQAGDETMRTLMDVIVSFAAVEGTGVTLRTINDAFENTVRTIRQNHAHDKVARAVNDERGNH